MPPQTSTEKEREKETRNNGREKPQLGVPRSRIPIEREMLWRGTVPPEGVHTDGLCSLMRLGGSSGCQCFDFIFLQCTVLAQPFIGKENLSLVVNEPHYKLYWSVSRICLALKGSIVCTHHGIYLRKFDIYSVQGME